MEINLNLNLNIDKNKEFYKTIAAITIPIALQNIISYSVNLMPPASEVCAMSAL